MPRRALRRKPRRVARDVGRVDCAGGIEMSEKPREERDVAVGGDGEMEVGRLGGRRSPRIDDDDAQAGPLLARGNQALVEHRVAPGEVRSDEDDEVGLLQILVAAGHHVGAESTAVAGDRRRHAQARIGVDIGRADEALHQLVGDVVVLGEQLAGNVEGDRVRPVLGDRTSETAGDRVEGHVPADAPAADLGMEQAAVEVDGFGEGRALGAQPAEIRRMVRDRQR